MQVPVKTIERLIFYRNILNTLKYQGVQNIYSHKLAELSGASSAQVRRDLMIIGYKGTPAKGYNVSDLESSIGLFLDNIHGEKIAIIGMGNLGTSLAEYCYWRYPNLANIVGFDIVKEKCNREYNYCRTYHIDDLEKIILKEKISVAIISVPAESAQEIAERLVDCGVKGILNYCPIHLEVPDTVYVENRDMLLAVEKVAYFSRNL